MVAPAVEGIDLFKIAGRSISGWVPSFKMGTTSPVKQPFCSQLEERLLLWLEYHPHVVSYARGDIGPQFATTYRLPIPKHAPFAIGYTFEGKPHDYLPDVVGTLANGKMFIAEAGMEDDKRGDRTLPLALLPPDAPAIEPPPLPEALEALLPEQRVEATVVPGWNGKVAGPTVDASALPEKQREQFHRNLRAVEQVLAGAAQTHVAKASGISRSTLSRLAQRTRERGQMACLPHGSYRRSTTMHPAFQECIRRLYLLPVRLSMTAIHEHAEMREVAARLEKDSGAPVKRPSYDQVRREIHRLSKEPDLVAVRERAKGLPRARSSPDSFVLSIPAPALLTQVDEHSLELYVVTPDGIAVTERVHAAVLVCVKTAAILGACLPLVPLKEEDYMRLVRQTLEPKDRLVGLTGCEHPWPCYGKPAIIFHDRGKIFTSERARQVLVDRLGIITEQAPPYAPSAKGTVESLFRWMTQRFERRLPNTSHGIADAQAAAQAGGMTLEELERCFFQAIVDDYQQAFDELRRQRRCVF